MRYGIFGKKIKGIRDIKTPPNGASINTHKKQHKTKQKQREKKNYIIWIRKCQTLAKSAPTAGFLTVPTTILASAVDHVIMCSCKIKKKDRDADISETDLVTGFFPTISDNILPTEQITQITLWSSITIIFDRWRVEDILMHFTGSQWNCLKLTTWFGSVAADISVLPLRKKIFTLQTS